jgi:hypothetical protein
MPVPNDPAFLSATAPYVPQWKEGWLERFIPRLTAKPPFAWSFADFSPSLGYEQLQTNIHNLLAEFVADQHQRGIPYGRADMAWEHRAIVKPQDQSDKRAIAAVKTEGIQNIFLIPAYATTTNLSLTGSILGAFPFKRSSCCRIAFFSRVWD